MLVVRKAIQTMRRPIKTAVFPVAGLGTRFLPATKAMPKEMLTVVDRPVIQIAVDEAREAGIEHFVFVTGRNKGVIADHFDKQFELEETLAAKGKSKELKALTSDLPQAGQASFTRQQEPLGLGHAVWCARKLVNAEPFALILPDMLTKGSPGCLAQMIPTYEEKGGNVIAVEEIPRDQVSSYGIVGVGEEISDKTFKISSMVEKPKVEDAPSSFIISGRYILQPEIFSEIEAQKPGAKGEIQITDAMIRLMAQQPFYGVRFDGQIYDCGNKVGFLMANVAYGLDRPEIAGEFKAALKALIP